MPFHRYCTPCSGKLPASFSCIIAKICETWSCSCSRLPNDSAWNKARTFQSSVNKKRSSEFILKRSWLAGTVFPRKHIWSNICINLVPWTFRITESYRMKAGNNSFGSTTYWDAQIAVKKERVRKLSFHTLIKNLESRDYIETGTTPMCH